MRGPRPAATHPYPQFTSLPSRPTSGLTFPVFNGVPTGNRLWISMAVTLLFVIGEGTAGVLSHSLALMSDAGHNFADVLALFLCWWANRMAQKPSNPANTYGYHRAGILSALANALSLIVIALIIFWEGIQRLQHPEPVQSGLMIGVAIVAIIMNAGISLGLRGEAKHDLNVRSAYIHMAGGAASALRGVWPVRLQFPVDYNV